MTAIYDTMQFIQPDVQTVCLGQAASAAAVLLAAGAPGGQFQGEREQAGEEEVAGEGVAEEHPSGRELGAAHGQRL